jgi:ABC-2 type transport system ATP-binding protein
MNIVSVDNVVKRYGDHTAVDHVSFSVPEGQIYGVLGPNGAGKTSTIRMMMRITIPDEGEIRFKEQPLRQIAVEEIGYLPEERGLYKKMHIIEMLVFLGQLKGLSRDEAKKRGMKWLERLELGDYATKTSEDLSKGMQQKVQFIATVIHEPELIILDEPFSGLDPVNTNVLKDIILEYHAGGHTIIFSTHMMEQVEKLCDYICLFNKGKVVLDGTLAGVKEKYGHGGVTLRFEGDGSFLRDLPGVDTLNDHGTEKFVRLADGTDPARILAAAQERFTVTRFDVAEPTIHDIFLERVAETS